MAATQDLSRIVSRLEKIVNQAATVGELQAVGEEAAKIVARRTQLGFGAAPGVGGQRFAHAPLSPSYVRFRETTALRYLSSNTTPSRSNLTLSGQMLESLGVIQVSRGSVVIGPTGVRSGPFGAGIKNAQLAQWLAERGRTFMGITTPEVSQLIRFYRTRFGDLVRRGT